MDRNLHEQRCRRLGFTRKELLIVILVIGVLIGLLIPAVQSVREQSRRFYCLNQVMQINLAQLNYEQVNKHFPAGTICSTSPQKPGDQYDVWGEAGRTGSKNHGTSFLLAILCFVEEEETLKTWASGKAHSGTTAGCWSPAANVGTEAEPGPAMINIQTFYCPSRRNGLRPQDGPMMLSPAWTGGGTDYGGCAGRHAAFRLDTGYNLSDATMQYDPGFCPEPFKGKDNDTPEKRLGIFGRVNTGTIFKEIIDGGSNTISIGELQRITDHRPESKDGWSVGGPATLFTTGALARLEEDENFVIFESSPEEGKLSNNGFFGSPGSDHVHGANYGFGDGSARILSTSMDPTTFALLGSMADGEPISSDKLR
jgi:type II secretory pathway pseudopilin PulG